MQLLEKYKENFIIFQVVASLPIPWFQRFIFPLPFAMKIIKINLWNQGTLPTKAC
jgi:hypothetical protein